MEEPAEMHFDIAPDFGVEAGVIVIKQEPEDVDLIIEQLDEEVMEPNFIAEDDDDEHQLYPQPEEIDDDIMQRAVSPPTYEDDWEIDELFQLYAAKYGLGDLRVRLENCDPIVATFQIIEDHTPREDVPPAPTIPQVEQPAPIIPEEEEPPAPVVPHRPTIGISNIAIPNLRFSIKGKKKIFHCLTCNRDYNDNQQLRQHAQKDHGIYVVPKRIYKPRADQIAKALRNNPNSSNQSSTSEFKSPDNMVKIPLSQASMQQMEVDQPVESQDVPETENSGNSSLNLNASGVGEPSTRSNHRLGGTKDRFRCILCKRVFGDMVTHLKIFHKVACLKTILSQCEKIVEDVPRAMGELNNTAPIVQSPEVPERMDPNVSLNAAGKKRRRSHPPWTIAKKKVKQNDFPQMEELPTEPSTEHPTEPVQDDIENYKCNICLGVYKTSKSYSHHMSLHRDRGETRENFNPSTSRFLNSPLRPVKGSNNKPPKQVINNYVRSQRQSPKVQTSITSYLKPQTEVSKPTEQASLQNVDNQNPDEPTECACGRSFRTYHTYYLHKVKCKETDGKGSQANDSDSGIGISIKIKKNKNDSYEVVPRTTPTEETFKESRSCKDSDAASNDSGVVSVDSNSQKADSLESAKYKTVSVLRIEVEDNDEEVDIENENSNHSHVNGHPDNSAITASSVSTEDNSLPNGLVHGKSSSKKNSTVPSSINLSSQAIPSSKGPKNHKCFTCKSHFGNTTDLMEHVSEMKHDVKTSCSCGKDFKNLKYYNRHVKLFHPHLLNCRYCKTNFDRVEKYLGHKCSVTEGEVFIEPIIQTECMECKAIVDLGEPFDKHMKTHSDGSFYQCYKCDLTFDNHYQRRAHFSKEHGFSPCRICGKVLHIDHLSKHEAYHDGLGHPCHLCKKTFSQKTLLKKHFQGTHDASVNQFVKCFVCSKDVKLRYLKKHMSFHLHTEICKKCNKCYRIDDPDSCEEHMAHSNNEPVNGLPVLKCDTCQITFVSDKDYEEHRQQNCAKSDAMDAENIVQNAAT